MIVAQLSIPNTSVFTPCSLETILSFVSTQLFPLKVRLVGRSDAHTFESDTVEFDHFDQDRFSSVFNSFCQSMSVWVTSSSPTFDDEELPSTPSGYYASYSYTLDIVRDRKRVDLDIINFNLLDSKDDILRILSDEAYPFTVKLLAKSDHCVFQSSPIVLHRYNETYICSVIDTWLSDIDVKIISHDSHFEDNDGSTDDFDPTVRNYYEGFTISMILSSNKEEDVKHLCSICKSTFSSADFISHSQFCARSVGKLFCYICRRVVFDRDHIKNCSVVRFDCNVCGERFTCGRVRSDHQKKCRVQLRDNQPVVNSVQSALNGRFKVVKLPHPTDSGCDYEGALVALKDIMGHILSDELGTGLRYFVGLKLWMTKNLGEDDQQEFAHTTNAKTLTQADEIEESIDAHILNLTDKVENFIRRGSGWLVKGITEITLSFTR